jgi:hypothetical protein
MTEPEMPSLEPGLPSTDDDSLKELVLAIIVQAVVDHDLRFVDTVWFNHLLLYLGMDEATAVYTKAALLAGAFDPRRFRVGFHRSRYEYRFE